jgi:hypothetical protein
MRNKLSGPLQLFGGVGVVVDLDRDRLALLKSQERSGKLVVVGDR